MRLRYTKMVLIFLSLIILSCQSDSTSADELYSSQNAGSSSSDTSYSSEAYRSSFAGSSSSSDDLYSSATVGSSSSYTISSSAVVGSSSSISTGSTPISFLKAMNSNLFQDIIFRLQSDSSYIADVAYEVDLSRIIPTFTYSGKVKMGDVLLKSGITSVNFLNETILQFDGKTVKFHVVRQYTIPTLHINTQNSAEVASDTEYVRCSLILDGKNRYADYSATDVAIRQRGNSSRTYYDKKPYRLKLGSKSALLGLKEDKDWVLLANYRDPTNFMNAVVFDMARYMELPYTNSNRFVEVYLNDIYIGMYQLTEQIEQGTNRVAVDEATGVLLNLDLDDGPELASSAGNNFYSSVYELPVCVKNPKNQTSAQLDAIKADFAVLENHIKNGEYTALSSRLDIQSFIDFLLIQELTRNVELVSPRSMYMYKSSDNIYHFGPVWDFDGGFAFDWASMSEGHEYFGSQSWLMGSSNPAAHPLDAYDSIPRFFVDLFANEDFVAAYKSRWNKLKSGILEYTFAKLDDYVRHCDSAVVNNAKKWPIGKDPDTEIQRMQSWLTERISSYSTVVESY
ncbi:MAG: hypothetical protein AUK31_07095 [Fibrobacteres bacterium CG2_30_45_31]|nr:MAG: hypothetical protein AUK31_07095 [Fibrobacteres bacterium CG2_30_45_31]